MKEKGIWNNYKGYLRKEIQAYCSKNQIDEKQVHFINIYKWETIYRNVIEKFVKNSSRNKSLYWLNTNGTFHKDKSIQAAFDSREHEEWILKFSELIADNMKQCIYC